MLLFETPHGSHLYGLAHANSDKDSYRVIATKHRSRLRNAKQNIKDGDDVTTIDFCTWAATCQKSVPQALEAMFSPVATFDMIGEYRNSFVVSRSTIHDTYRRTVTSFSFGNFKQRRHAMRLCLNLWTAWEYGRFNPMLSEKQIKFLNEQMSKPDYESALQDMLDGNF